MRKCGASLALALLGGTVRFVHAAEWHLVMRVPDAYAMTPGQVGDVCSPYAFGKHSDSVINAIHEDGSPWNTFKLVSCGECGSTDPLYVRTQQAHVDTAEKFGWGAAEYCQAAELADCVWQTDSSLALDTFFGVSGTDDCSRWFSDMSWPNGCFDTDDTSLRCFNSGTYCHQNCRRTGVRIYKWGESAPSAPFSSCATASTCPLCSPAQIVAGFIEVGGQCQCPANKISGHLSVQMDGYWMESGWSLVSDATGETLLQQLAHSFYTGDPVQPHPYWPGWRHLEPNKLYIDGVCLTPGNYTLRVFDLFGDALGGGYYTMEVGGVQVRHTSDGWTSEDISSFTVCQHAQPDPFPLGQCSCPDGMMVDGAFCQVPESMPPQSALSDGGIELATFSQSAVQSVLPLTSGVLFAAVVAASVWRAGRQNGSPVSEHQKLTSAVEFSTEDAEDGLIRRRGNSAAWKHMLAAGVACVVLCLAATIATHRSVHTAVGKTLGLSEVQSALTRSGQCVCSVNEEIGACTLGDPFSVGPGVWSSVAADNALATSCLDQCKNGALMYPEDGKMMCACTEHPPGTTQKDAGPPGARCCAKPP